MRKILLAFALLCSNAIFAQLVTFDYSISPTASNSNDPRVSSSTLTLDGLSRTNTSSGGAITYSGWNNDGDRGIAFTVTPTTGSQIDFQSIFVNDVRRVISNTTTGASNSPTSLVIRTSLDNFATDASNVEVITTTARDLTFQLSTNLFPQLINRTTPVTFRIQSVAGGNGSPSGRQIIIGGTGIDIEIDGFAEALPVRFGNVKATRKSNSVGVSFSNYTEEEVAVYHVERSTNDYQFQSIGTIAPKANNNSRVDYLFNDAAPAAGDNYYRIRAVETTGKQVYSSVVKVGVSDAAASLVLYPNPASKASGINLQLANLPAGVYSIRLYNGNGQVIATKQLQHTGGSLSEALPLQGAGAGRYIVEVKGAVQFTQSFLLQ